MERFMLVAMITAVGLHAYRSDELRSYEMR